MFDETTYNVCSFAFKKNNNIEQDIDIFIYDKELREKKRIKVSKQFNYRIGGDFFEELSKVKVLFSRLTIDKPQNPTNISVICIDSKDSLFHFYFDNNHYYGKKSDRNLATLSSDLVLTEEIEKEMVKKANEMILDFRNKMGNLVFTNFRDRNRKRIGFTEAYQIMSKVYMDLYN